MFWRIHLQGEDGGSLANQSITIGTHQPGMEVRLT